MADRPCLNMVWSSASKTLIGPLPWGFSPIGALLPCVNPVVYRLGRGTAPPLFTQVRGRVILRSSPSEVAALYTKIGLLADAPNTECLLQWRIIRAAFLPILPGGPFLMRARSCSAWWATANARWTHRACIP